jgi:ribosomal protein L35
LTKKTTKSKRALTGTTIVDVTDLPRVKAMLTIGK